ncbi:MAG: hypothetical protein WA979_01040, partial [Pacificimonas sp.]
PPSPTFGKRIMLDRIAPLTTAIAVPARETATVREEGNKKQTAPATEKSDLVVRKAPESERFIYEFRDPDTGKLTRQFPSEASLAIGALLDERV